MKAPPATILHHRRSVSGLQTQQLPHVSRFIFVALGVFIIKSVIIVDGSERRSTRNIPLHILDEIFPNQSLDTAWETHPLLVSIYPEVPIYQTSSNKAPSCHACSTAAENTIPTMCLFPEQNVDAASELKKRRRINFFQSLFRINDVNELLSHSNLVPTKDFQMAKKIIRNGEEWLGILPQDKLSSKQALEAFYLGKFSLVVNGLHRRWEKIGQFSRYLELEILPFYVSCNLYLTPPVGSAIHPENDDAQRRQLESRISGFEAHWDWMDVIVLQISGEKLWSVSSSPVVYLSNKDQKRKPTLAELEAYHAADGRYDEFLLRPGDALYIPRGFLHNASTIGLDVLLKNNGKERHHHEPSLHLTFGIEHGCETTFEALIHHSVELFALTEDRSVAINKSTSCKNKVKDDITWCTVLHMAVSGVARNVSCKGSDVDSACILRKSVAIHPAWAEIGSLTRKYSATETDVSATDGPVLRSYSEGLHIVRSYANLERTATFLDDLFHSEDMQNSFCISMVSLDDVVPCSPSLILGLSHTSFFEYMGQFINFAAQNFEPSLQRLYKRNVQQRVENWHRDDEVLKSVGHNAIAMPGYHSFEWQNSS